MDNERYFDKIRAEYQAAIADSSEAYANIGRLLDERLKGRVLDFGNGGVINYQTAHLEHLTCVDLMPPPAPASGATSWEQGDFYSYDFSAGPDQVLVQFLLHHLPEDESLELPQVKPTELVVNVAPSDGLESDGWLGPDVSFTVICAESETPL